MPVVRHCKWTVYICPFPMYLTRDFPLLNGQAEINTNEQLDSVHHTYAILSVRTCSSASWQCPLPMYIHKDFPLWNGHAESASMRMSDFLWSNMTNRHSWLIRGLSFGQYIYHLDLSYAIWTCFTDFWARNPISYDHILQMDNTYALWTNSIK